MSSKTFQASGEVKSWKKLNEERKIFKKERKQEKLIQSLELNNKLKEQAKQDKLDKPKPPNPTPSTISLAVPGSILENAQSAELRAYVAGQVARAASIFRVNEIIIFDDICIATPREQTRLHEAGEDSDKFRIVRKSSMQLARILQYLECPQYLRKFFFPMHKDLQYSGLLNPLDTPHHLRQQSVFRYREGVISEKTAKEGCSYANIGLVNDVLVDKPLAPGVRVTVRLGNLHENSKKLRGSIVSPDEPRRETGIYWGYNVRISNSLSDIFTGSPYEGGYDLTIGTSDRGNNVQKMEPQSLSYNHLLIVFGGLKGLETALTNDDHLHVDDPSLLFDHYINVLPRQGSRTIRTEEALLIALAALQEKLNAKVPDIEEELIDEILPQSTDTGNNFPRLTAPMNKNRKRQLSTTNSEENSEEIRPKNKNNMFRKDQIAENNNTEFKAKNFNNKFRKSTTSENNEDGETATLQKFNKHFKKPHLGKNSNEEFTSKNPNNKFRRPQIQETDADDFEVVPTSVKATANISKADVDLSRFD